MENKICENEGHAYNVLNASEHIIYCAKCGEFRATTVVEPVAPATPASDIDDPRPIDEFYRVTTTVGDFLQFDSYERAHEYWLSEPDRRLRLAKETVFFIQTDNA